MMRRNREIAGLGAVLLMGMVACGAAGRSSSPPQAPPNEPAAGAAPNSEATAKDKTRSAAPAPAAPASPVYDTSAEESAPPPAAAPATQSSARSETLRGGDPHGAYTRATLQLSESRRRLDIAATQRDCANACRALDSMERAAGQLCELAQSSEEHDTCRSAEDQLGSARQKVKNAC